MIEVAPSMFVGSAADEAAVRDNPEWYIISAARDPWHRQALGYTTRGAPKDHPEYLMARRGNRLILNLVDAADPAYISDALIEVALHDMGSELAKGSKVLVHCNQGLSRSPTIAMLYMAKHGPLREMLPFEVIQNFKRIYPDYAPAEGMRLYAQRWLEKNLTAA